MVITSNPHLDLLNRIKPADWTLTFLKTIVFVDIISNLTDQSDPGREQQHVDEDKLAQIIKDSGYSFDPNQKIFYSVMDGWQKQYGYCQLYDEATAPLSMILDCEPIRFEYDNKRWLIELWKGQYGITTGCEMGVYVSEGPDLNIPNVFNGTYYHSVSDEDRLPMSFTLKKNQHVLFRRSETHWWLTGFILGEFSEPSELVMDVEITLKSHEMREAFVSSLLQMGYSAQEIEIINDTVKLTFSTPYSKQPFTRSEWICSFNQKKNKFLCKQYLAIAKGCRSMHEILERVAQQSPELFELIMMMGKSSKRFQAYENLVKYLDKKDYG